MPTFDTPTPIAVTLELVVGDVRITATDRTDTVVEVRPGNAGTDADVRAAEQTRIEYADGRLLVRTPRQRGFGLFGRSGSVDVTVALPAGSTVEGTTSVGTITATGALGRCRMKTSAGDIALDRASEVDLDTSAGTVTVERVAGAVRVSTGTGRVHVGEVGGDAVVKNSNGDSWLGTVAGDLRVKAANGDIVVECARGSVDAATANGTVRLGEVTAGSVSVRTARGDLDIGVRAGTAALLDLQTHFGRVHNQLSAANAPGQPDQAGTVRVSANTAYGDILLRRA